MNEHCIECIQHMFEHNVEFYVQFHRTECYRFRGLFYTTERWISIETDEIVTKNI